MLRALFTLLLAQAILQQAKITAQQLTPSQHKFLQRCAAKRLDDRPDFVARLVQMSFHDCVGGCDGCINLKHHGNRGLESTYEFVKDFRNDFAPHLSLADVIALLGVEALRRGAAEANNTVDIPYSIGRPDCDSSKGMPTRPLPEHDTLHSIPLLKDMFDLDDEEAVALLGCHSLGSCHRNRSGFHGDWDARPHALDSGFYLNLASNDWTLKNNSNEFINGTSWVRPRESFLMLHSDMIMLKNYTLGDDPMRTPSCNTSDSCPNSDTADIVFEFARDEKLFMKKLGVAFRKMIDGKNKNLKLIAS